MVPVDYKVLSVLSWNLGCAQTRLPQGDRVPGLSPMAPYAQLSPAE